MERAPSVNQSIMSLLCAQGVCRVGRACGRASALGHTGAGAAGGTHLREYFVKPLQRAVEVDLNPAGRGGDCLPPVLRAPPLHKAHADGAHARQLEHALKALVHRLAEQRGKLLVVEDLEVASGWDLADGGGVPAVALVAVGALHKQRAVTQALGKHLPTNVVQAHAFA